MGVLEFITEVSEVDLAVKKARAKNDDIFADNPSRGALNRFDNRANELEERHPNLLSAIDAVRSFVDDDTLGNPAVRALIGSRALHVLGVCEQFGQISEDLAQIRAAEE